MRGLYAELKRRNVLRAAAFYVAAVWALSQGISQLSAPFGLANWVTRWFVFACAIGFPFWIAFAWFYEFTPQGLKREAEIAEDASSRHSTARKLDFAIIGVLVVAVALLGSGYFIRRPAPMANAGQAVAFHPPATSIVVLPFKNLSGDPSQQYFSDGITEELTGALGQNTGLTVIAWETASTFRNPKQTAGEVGRKLDVAHILDGSIQREGDEVRVSVELVNTVTGQELWSAHYDDSLKNIFAVQDRITSAIAGTLNVKFASLGAVPTLNPQAHDLYLKGLAALDRLTAADAQAAQDYFQQALKLDPNYADAWAGLAYTYVQLSQISTLPIKEALPKLRAAAQKALALDPHNANALLALGNADREEPQAKADLRQATQLDPSNAHAHLDYGLMLPVKQSLVQEQEAARLDPDNALAQEHLSADYSYLGIWPQAVAAALKEIKLSPRHIAGAFFLAFAFTSMHRNENAVKAFDLVQPKTTIDRQLVDAGRLTYQALSQPSRRPKALSALDKLRHADLSPESQLDLLHLYAALGEKVTMLQMLPGFCAAAAHAFCYDLAVNPMYVPLRGDPRFEKLAKQYTAITRDATPASASSR